MRWVWGPGITIGLNVWCLGWLLMQAWMWSNGVWQGPWMFAQFAFCLGLVLGNVYLLGARRERAKARKVLLLAKMTMEAQHQMLEQTMVIPTLAVVPPGDKDSDKHATLRLGPICLN